MIFSAKLFFRVFLFTRQGGENDKEGWWSSGEEERSGRISGDELYIVLGHQTNSALQDSLQPAGLQAGTN